MTNFLGQPSRSSGLLTPERLVLLLPITAGAALLLLVVMIGYPPLLLQWQQRREAISALLAQEAALPLLRGQIVASELQLQGKQQQQERLLTLVAGTGQLRTWLASLNDIAAATGVSVSFVEPGAVEVFVPPPRLQRGSQLMRPQCRLLHRLIRCWLPIWRSARPRSL